MELSEEFDLTDGKRVVALGDQMGSAWMNDINPLIQALSDEKKILFLVAMLGHPIGTMLAALGHERSCAILQTLQHMLDKTNSEVNGRMN